MACGTKKKCSTSAKGGKKKTTKGSKKGCKK